MIEGILGKPHFGIIFLISGINVVLEQCGILIGVFYRLRADFGSHFPLERPLGSGVNTAGTERQDHCNAKKYR